MPARLHRCLALRLCIAGRGRDPGRRIGTHDDLNRDGLFGDTGSRGRLIGKGGVEPGMGKERGEQDEREPTISLLVQPGWCRAVGAGEFDFRRRNG
jgi:hypothetical protein